MPLNYHNQQTIVERVQYWAEKQPDAEAFVFIDKDGLRSVLTCKEVCDQAVLFAKQLRRLGLIPGEIVCSMLPDSPNGLIAIFGIMFAGCLVNSGGLKLSDGSIMIRNLNRAKCRVLLLSSDPDNECRRVFTRLLQHRENNRVSSETLPHVSHVIYTLDNHRQGFQWTELNPGEELLEDHRAIWNDRKSDIMLSMTSGSTGKSKMVVLPSELTTSCMKMWGVISVKSKSACICFHPLTWGMGMPFYFLATGQKRVLIDQRNPPTDDKFYEFVYDIIVQENCDFSIMTASHLVRLVEIAKVRSGWPLRGCQVGGYPLSKSTLECIMPHIDTLFNYYGITEIGLVSHKQVDKTTVFEDFNCGHVPGDIQVKIVDDDYKPVQNGETGSVLLKSPRMFNRYLNDEEVTASAFTKDGFFKTGDAGYLNKHGELIIFGRVSEVISKASQFYHPAWIQNSIKTCPGVADVMVVKVPDSHIYNEICACVVLEPNSKLDEDAIMEFCLQKFVKNNVVDASPCPRYIIIMDKIPLNKNSKPDRLETEKYAAKFLNLGPNV